MITGVIYLITNIEHKKAGILPYQYIGSKKSLVEWNKGKYYGSSKSLSGDVNNQGKQNFKREILEIATVDTYRDLVNRELEIIVERNAVEDLTYYNLSDVNRAAYDADALAKTLSKTTKLAHLLRSQKEKDIISSKISKTLKEHRRNMSTLERNAESSKHKQRWKDMSTGAKESTEHKRLSTYFAKSESEKRAIVDKRLATFNAKPNEEKQIINQKRILAIHPTDPTKAKQISAKAVATRINKTSEEKNAIYTKRKLTMETKSIIEIAEMRKKMGASGSENANAKSVSTPAGSFSTLKEAAKYYHTSYNTIGNRCGNHGKKWSSWYYN